MTRSGEGLSQVRICETIAGIDALDPRVIKVCVADRSTLPKPSTAATTTTELAGFLNCATLWTFVASNRWHSCPLGGFCGHIDDKIFKKHKSRCYQEYRSMA